MDLQIEIEPEARPTALYRMLVDEVVVAFRNAEALLAHHGITRDQAAAALGLSPATLVAYARGVSTTAHRTIDLEQS